MSWSLYAVLSVMMFLQFAVWGAWSPVLAARLLGPLKFSGKQTGWIYGTFPLASLVAPMLAGQLADRWIAAEWILLAAHLLGAVLLFVAARQEKFLNLFVVMGLYSLCYASTLPLVFSLMFSQLTDPGTQSLWVLIWAPAAWALVGYLLAGWRKLAGTDSDGRDCLVLAGVLSLVMAASCFFLPHTPPKGAAGDALAFVKAFSMLKDSGFLIFLAISFVVTTQLQFYYLGTAQYLQDLGVKSQNVPAAMALAQAAQAIATLLAAYFEMVPKLGYAWTLTIGIVCWLVMYLAYSAMRPRWFVVASQALHGLAYVFFINCGQIYVDKVAPADIRSSAQGLLAMVTMGLGLFLGTQFTGVVMDALRVEGKFRWRPIFLIPCALTLASAVALAALFHP